MSKKFNIKKYKLKISMGGIYVILFSYKIMKIINSQTWVGFL